MSLFDEFPVAPVMMVSPRRLLRLAGVTAARSGNRAISGWAATSTGSLSVMVTIATPC